jgi:hypothetical protein
VTDKTLDQLARRGHKIGTPRMTHEGKITIDVDGRVLSYPEIDQMLADHIEAERA